MGIEVTSPDLLQVLGDLKIEVNSLKIERDKIVQEQEATKIELEIELETKEKKEKVLENDIKDLESEISKLKKLVQDNQDLVNEVGEVQNKLTSALTDIESANKLNEAHLEKFENLQSLHKSSEEKLKMEIERLKNELL